MEEFPDLICETKDQVAWITINRPHRYNALTQKTFGQFSVALAKAGADTAVGVIVISGAGGKAFTSGGDVKERTPEGYGDADMGEGISIMRLLRMIPKPIIAMVDGYAIGWGNILAFNCDLTICSERSRFGQTGPRVGSYDVGWGTTYLARLVGPKKAREIWYLCRQYTADEALAMGLVNAVVPHEQLREEVEQWCREILAKSPTAIAMIKASFNPDTEHIAGIHQLGHLSLEMYYRTEEAQEGAKAFNERRDPDFSRFPRAPMHQQG